MMAQKTTKTAIFIILIALILGCISGFGQESTTTTQITVTVPQPTVSTYPPKVVNEVKDAIASGDTNKCSNLPDQDLKDACLREVAVENKDFRQCDLISKQTKKDACNMKIAVLTGQKSLCNKIVDQEIKKVCLS
jgi:hypothetical protein